MTAPIYKRQEMVTVQIIAARWGMSLGYIYQLIESGKLAAFKFGGCLRVHIEKVIEYENSAEFHAGACLCWVVGRSVSASDCLTAHSDTWQLQGLAINEADAAGMCRDASYFIGPVPFNTALPHEQAEWEGCYYPLATA